MKCPRCLFKVATSQTQISNLIPRVSPSRSPAKRQKITPVLQAVGKRRVTVGTSSLPACNQGEDAAIKPANADVFPAVASLPKKVTFGGEKRQPKIRLHL